MERCKDRTDGWCLELDRRHGLCPCVHFWGRVRFLSLACTCIAHAACVLFARVCQAITLGVPHTNPLRVPVGPPLLIVHGCINVTCNTNDVHKPRRPHTCTRHAHGRLITHTLAMYVILSVIVVVITVWAEILSQYTMPLLSFSSSQPPLSTSPHRLDVRAALII